ncbi:MAG: YdgA family protein [Burkholderiaceae bacterium]|jgi:uncharacterized protein YdgA (DUF945 family)|nr:YdgA family protein [Burkholderiaceae bacterium]
MKKIWISLVVIVVVITAWLGAAWYTGARIQTEIGSAIERVNAKLAQNRQAMGMQVEPLSYQRGLLSSHARFAVTSSALENASVMEYDVIFSHGPFPLAALRHGKLWPLMYQMHVQVRADTGMLKMIAGSFMGGKSPLVLDMGCSYGSHCTGTGNVPPIDVNLGALANNVQLAFGGIQMRFDVDHPSASDGKLMFDAQLLPLAINEQKFGDGQITLNLDAKSNTETEVLSWKTDQGTSKLALTLTTVQPMSLLWGGSVPESQSVQDLSQVLKTASAKLELSRPMVIDLMARFMNLTKGIDLEAARQLVSEQLDNDLQAGKFTQTQENLLVSDWQYMDDKLTINGQENPEMLERIKQGLMRLDARP